MEIVIKIPKEFENHFNNDRFMDSFNRIIFDIEQCNQHGAEYDAISGNYEIETLRMLKDSILDSKKLSKGHGRIKDIDKIEWYGCTTAFDCPHKDRECKDCDRAECSKTQVDAIPTIIEADRGESEVEG